MKSGSPSWTTAAHKTQTKIQAWSSLIFHCRHSSFNPSEAPPWDSRPVSGAGVVHYHLLHRPRSVPTALGPAPLATYPHRPSQAGGYPRDCALPPPPPPLPGGARQGGRGVPGGKDRRGERKGDGRMRSDREERGERGKKKHLGPVPGHTAARSSTSWAAHSPPLLDPGAWQRPTSVPPVLLLLQHHRFGQPLAVSATSCCPISSAPRSPSAARALWQRVPPSSRVSAPM